MKKIRILAVTVKIIFQFLIKPSSSYFDVVEKICKDELKKRPNNFYVSLLLGQLYVQNNKHWQAVPILESIYKAGSQGQKLKRLLARAYFNIKDYENVINILQNTKIKANNSTIYYLGVSLIEKGEVQKGIEYLEKYLISHPHDYNVHWKLGYELFRIGEYRKALNSYLKARELKHCKELDEGIKLCHERLKTISKSGVCQGSC